mgnify:CR=1 FL=1
MKASKMMLATLKEAPQEAQIASHVLLIRAGMIRKLVAGVYNYLPLGLRVLKKIGVWTKGTILGRLKSCFTVG